MTQNKENEEIFEDNTITKRESPKTLTKDKEELLNTVKEMSPENMEILAQNVAMIERSEFSGPLPTPDYLKGYEECCPGAADRIITMAEKEQEHRLAHDDKVLDVYKSSEHKGLNFAFIVTMSFLIIGSLIVFIGKSVEGFIVLAPVITQFIVHVIKDFNDDKPRKKENKENKENNDLRS